jgi:hypothetical protein
MITTGQSLADRRRHLVLAGTLRTLDTRHRGGEDRLGDV